MGDQRRISLSLSSLEGQMMKPLKIIYSALLLAAAPMLADAPAHQSPVIGDRIPVTGQQAVQRHRRGPPEVAQVFDSRLRSRSGGFGRGDNLGVGGDPGKQVIADERGCACSVLDLVGARKRGAAIDQRCICHQPLETALFDRGTGRAGCGSSRAEAICPHSQTEGADSCRYT